jgi:hypothetical protein
MLMATRDPAFVKWLRRRLRRKKQKPAASTTLEMQGAPPVPIGSVQKAVAHLPAVSLHWGRKWVAGKPTRRTAAVVEVDRKRSPKWLRAHGEPVIPKTVQVTYRGKPRRVLLDVVERRRPARFHVNVDVAAPGANVPIGTSGETLGTLGGVVTLANGHYALTAGHVAAIAAGAALVARWTGPPVSLGKVFRSITDGRGDAALIGPLQPSDGLTGMETFLKDPTKADVHRRAWVLLKSGTPREFVIDGVGLTREFTGLGGPSVQVGNLVALVTADGKTGTKKGDSGAPVLDDDGFLIGLVVGSDSTATYVSSARRSVHAL